MSLRRTCSLLLSALSLGAAFIPTAEAGGVAGLARQTKAVVQPMREGPTVLAPFAFIRYCVASPEACPKDNDRRLEWTAANKRMVSAVNQRTNRAIRPRNERGDTWQANVAAGDCEDFALTKRQALLQAGLPAASLRIAVATTGTGEGHAVLVVKTEAGDFVLDNRHNRLLPWNETDLRFIKITSAENPRVWRRLL